jgi:hypothetical protein
MRRHGCERGQATVELVALLPLLALLGMALWQAVVAGQAIWLAGSAARAAARATAVGADPAAAARRALPSALERGLRVEPRDTGAVRVAVAVPAVVGSRRLTTVTATAAFPPQS